MFQEFPKWKYGKDGSSLIVENNDQENALGDEYFNSPDEVTAFNDLVKKAPNKKAE